MIDFDLLIKYFAGKAAPEEAMLIEDWAKASEDNYAFFTSLHQSWVEAGDEVYKIPEVQQEWQSFSNRHSNSANVQPLKAPSSGKIWISRVAAAVAIVLVGFAGYYLFNAKNQNQPTEIALAEEKVKTVKLPDGSQVEVQPEGELVYPIAFKGENREVTLIGSGSFDIAEDVAHPFIIHLGDLHIKVVGTSFDVNKKAKEISVNVHKGVVLFYNKKDTVRLSAGQTGRYITSDQKFLLEEIPPVTGSFQFNNTPLSEVAAALGQHFKINIQLINPALAHCKLSAGFEDLALAEILNDISHTFNLKYKLEGRNVSIEGDACE